MLQLLLCAGWVHRDISSANILAHRTTSGEVWQAKLADLEFARKYATEAPQEAESNLIVVCPRPTYDILTLTQAFSIREQHGSCLTKYSLKEHCMIP